MKNKFGLFDKDLEDIHSILNQHPKVERAVIFGSRAKGNYKNGSDVDIALQGEDIDFDTISQISHALNEETNMPYRFDVLNYNGIKEPLLLDHIDRIGVEIYNR
jgi:predicted nucleotidyltransferase